jgi:hypothetical protein
MTSTKNWGIQKSLMMTNRGIQHRVRLEGCEAGPVMLIQGARNTLGPLFDVTGGY